ncbi:MAG: CRISPR-associated endonuclease Cas2 [Proteobacteria bacterium]|nr:CRISPR-associated endonuclease Cas2 [Pseudomonadota bacterium]
MSRTLYIVAYDISDERRLAKVHYFLKNFSTGGQKSVYECFLSPAELEKVKNGLMNLIHPFEDRIHIFTLDGRSKTHTLGIAIQPQDPDYFYIG